MSGGRQLALFAAGMILVFGGGYAAGDAIDPDPGANRAPAHSAPSEATPAHGQDTEHGDEP